MIDLFYFSFEDEELIYTKGNNDFKIIYQNMKNQVYLFEEDETIFTQIGR